MRYVLSLSLWVFVGVFSGGLGGRGLGFFWEFIFLFFGYCPTPSNGRRAAYLALFGLFAPFVLYLFCRWIVGPSGRQVVRSFARWLDTESCIWLRRYRVLAFLYGRRAAGAPFTTFPPFPHFLGALRCVRHGMVKRARRRSSSVVRLQAQGRVSRSQRERSCSCASAYIAYLVLERISGFGAYT